MKKKQYEPTMPSGTADAIEAFGFSEEWVFSLQIELAVEWLETQIHSAQVRECLYRNADFWCWYLADWGAVDDVMMLSMKECEAGFRISNGRGGHVVLRSQPDAAAYYQATHERFYSGKEWAEMPSSVRVKLHADIDC